MKQNFRKFLSLMKDPPLFGKILIFIIFLLSASASAYFLTFDFVSSSLAVFAYATFAIAALSLTHAVFLLIRNLPSAKRKFIASLEKHDFTYLLLRSFGFRTLIFALFSFALNILFGGFNAYLGIKNKSVWYGALAAYYIALAFLRGGILWYYKKRISKKDQEENETLKKARAFCNAGIVTLILNVALSAAIAQMLFDDAHFSFPGWMVFAYAAYAFYKITMSVINLIRANHQSDLTVKAIRNVNLTDAIVSILALQTALLAVYANDTALISLFNTITGIVVSLTSNAIGIFMIVKANKIIKKEKEHKRNGIETV